MTQEPTTGVFPKNWWKSRTIWLNAAALAVWALNTFVVPADFHIDPTAMMVAQAAANLITIVLRTRTTQPVQ